MAKRYKIKVEVEFECPATMPPQEAFYQYWDARRNVEKDKVKLIEHSVFTIPSKVDANARAHNEARRVLQVVLDQSGLKTKIVKGYRTKWGVGSSNFQVHIDEPTAFSRDGWISVSGSTVSINRIDYDLVDPTAVDKLIMKMKCHWHLCSHQNQVDHV